MSSVQHREREVVRPRAGQTLQLTDDEVIAAQAKSRLAQKMITAKVYRGMK
ncbi:hypothetical protein F441_10402, partial [Phytophthora nicotianae CJ01A1]